MKKGKTCLAALLLGGTPFSALAEAGVATTPPPSAAAKPCWPLWSFHFVL
jgi:hypothetical protein